MRVDNLYSHFKSGLFGIDSIKKVLFTCMEESFKYSKTIKGNKTISFTRNVALAAA
jgi:flagellar assembly factor FliW